MSFCHKCGNETAENTKFCGSCGTALQNSTTEEHKENIAKEALNAHMVAYNIKVLTWEIIILSAIAGLYLKSWYIFGGVFFGLLILYLSFRKIAIILNFIFTLAWGTIGYLFGYFFNDEKHFTKASIILCLIGLLLSASIHFSISYIYHKK